MRISKPGVEDGLGGVGIVGRLTGPACFGRVGWRGACVAMVCDIPVSDSLPRPL